MDMSADLAGDAEMAPKTTPTDPKANENVEEMDLQEMEAVNDRLDALSSALDFFEQRTDNIIEQLKELLHSNREIREELAKENKTIAPDDSDTNKDTDIQ